MLFSISSCGYDLGVKLLFVTRVGFFKLLNVIKFGMADIFNCSIVENRKYQF